MKKFITAVRFVLCFVLCLSIAFAVGCKEENPLYSRVSELRCDLFAGSGENFNLSACYGFKETPYENDAKTSARVYLLTFRLTGKETDDVIYTVNLEYDGKTYSSTFKLNPVTHSVTANIEIENFNLKEFTVAVSDAAQSENVILRSILPEDAMDYKKALDYLYAEQRELINVYTDADGNFNAEIYARVVVKNKKPYWYIGIASGNGNLKALLIDGYTGETLAIREIF